MFSTLGTLGGLNLALQERSEDKHATEHMQ